MRWRLRDSAPDDEQARSRTQWLRLSFFLLAATLTAHTAGAQDVALSAGGYGKNLAIRSQTFLSGETYFFNISRLRLKGLGDLADRVHAEVWLDNELWSGNFLKTQDFDLGQRAVRPTFVDMSWIVSEGNEMQFRQNLFRAFATVYAGGAEVTVGRQRIAWGTGFAWNPTDLLNPFNPSAIELEEKTGVDAVHVTVPLTSLSRAEAVFAPGRGALKSSGALRFSGHVGEYDFSLMAGDFQDDRVLGADFAGYLGSAGVRGELAHTWREGGDRFLRAVINADYNFPGDIYAFAEFYYNGQGVSDKNNYQQVIPELLTGRVFNLAKFYSAFSANKSITPLLVLNVYGLANLNDGSSLLGPALTYSLFTDLEITVSAYLTRGSQGSEYGLQQSSYFASAQFYF